MDEAQLAQLLSTCDEHRDVQARQVANGFVLNGNRRFLNKGTGVVQAALQVEGVAPDTAAASEAVDLFLTSGKFN